MKEFFSLIFIITFLLFSSYAFAQTYSGKVYLSSQADVDNFAANGYTEITGNLTLDGQDISNLAQLATLTFVGGNLTIGQILGGNPSLSKLEGLHNIAEVGGTLYIAKNSSLTNLDGLRSIETVGKNLSILNNNSLADIDGLKSITSIGNDPSADGNLSIQSNPSLTNLDGLGNITSVRNNGFVSIKDNTSLGRFCGLYGIFTSNWQGNYYVSGNMVNPTKEAVISDGACSPTKLDKSKTNSPVGFSLSQNYPNPFNPETTISYFIPRASLVKLIVYDQQGRMVSQLVNKRQATGEHQVRFNAAGLASGVYSIKLQADNFSQIKKAILIK